MGKKKYNRNIYSNIFYDGGDVEKAKTAVKQAKESVGLSNVFLDEWNKQRLATGRFDDLLGEGLIDILKANRDSAPIYTSPIKYGANSYLRTMPLVKAPGMSDDEAGVKRLLDAILFGRRFMAKSMNTIEGGVEGTMLGEYNPKANTIYANPKGGESTLLHELAHASLATPLEDKIHLIMGTRNSSGTSYYDRPTEIYSRLMQFRLANNLNPQEIIDEDRLKELKKTATDFNLLNRYKDDLLLRLFNDVAQVDTPTNDLFNYAAYGGRINKFDLGGPVGGIVPKGYGLPNFNLTSKIDPSKVGIPSGGAGGAGSGFLSNLGSSITSFLGSGLGINMLSNTAFGLLNPNGNSTKFGNTLQGIGSLTSKVPGLEFLGTGFEIAGGVFNTLLGSNINEENVALFRNLNKQLANYTSNASTNEELLADFAGMSHLANVKKSDVGSDGWFSNKAKNLTKDINAERLRANLAAITSLGNTALTVDTTNDLLKGYNFSAYGGPINMRYTGTMSPFGNLFKDGGIFIKPSKRGTFTATAKKHGKSVLAFASQVLANKENYSPAMVKKANFARNAAKFKHKDGGPLDNLVADINTRSKADFVQRLLDPNRAFILDWATGGIATHKLGWATDDNGEAIVFPSVQRINGELYDFTDPKNGRGKWDAYDSAVERGDTLRMTPEQADLFTRTYKGYYPKGRTFEGELNAAKLHDEGGPLFNYNNLKKDDYGLLTYNGTPVLSSEDSSRRTSKDKSTRRDTPLGYLVGDENLNTANLIWGGMELLPVVGNIMGIADVANDVYNMANSDNISSGDFGNLLLDIGGLIPGISTFTKGSKLAKAAKLRKAASKLDNAAESLKYTSSDGIKEIKKRVKDAKDFSKKSSEEATKAALSRNKEDLYKASMKAREAAKFNEGILNGVERALDPFWSRYNIYLNVGTKADALNDIFGFMGSIEDNTKAFGGELTHGGVFSNGTSIIGNGGTHEENPYDGIQVGVDELGIPNLVELDEVIWNDYVFSNRLKVPKAVKLKYKLRGNKELSFADAAKNILKESEERPNDPISLNGLDAALSRLAMEQELIRMKKELRLNRYAEGGELGNLYKGTGPKSNFLLFKKKSYPNPFTTPNFSLYAIKDPFKIPEPRYTTPDFSVSLLKPNASSLKGYMSDVFEPISKDIFNTKVTETEESSNDTRKFREDPLRYAPIFGHAAGVINDIFSKPDYLASDEVRDIELNPSLVGFTPIANKLRYKPLDTLRLLNPLNALASALRRNVMNISGGNRAIAMAGLLNVDQNLGNQVGQALMSADEYNLASEERREAFNRATDLYNAEMGLKAAMANAESRNAMAKARYERDKIAALLSQLARDAYNTRRSNNLNILLEDLGNLGRERNNRNWLDILADKGIIKMNTKGEHVSSNTGKNGGKLNRKKKGGWEYA